MVKYRYYAFIEGIGLIPRQGTCRRRNKILFFQLDKTVELVGVVIRNSCKGVGKMKKKNLIGIIIGIIIISIIRIIDTGDRPFYVVILGSILVISALFVMVFKGQHVLKKEQVYLFFIALSLTLLLCVVMITVFLKKCYPIIAEQYQSLILILMGISFLLFFGVDLCQ